MNKTQKTLSKTNCLKPLNHRLERFSSNPQHNPPTEGRSHQGSCLGPVRDPTTSLILIPLFDYLHSKLFSRNSWNFQCSNLCHCSSGPTDLFTCGFLRCPQTWSSATEGGTLFPSLMISQLSSQDVSPCLCISFFVL